ncbi:hypothetical protein Angca_000531, partial [Angiostrongylus cantonensis]
LPPAMTDSITELKIAYFKLCGESKHRFTIDYNEKHEIYEALQKKVGELRIPLGSAMLAVTGYDSIQINSTDTLFPIVNDYPTVRIIVRTENQYSPSSSDSVNKARGPPGRKRRTRNRSRTRSHSRSRCHSHSRECHRPHSRNHHLYSTDLQSKRREHHSYSP